MIVEEESACAVVKYDLLSPKGNKFSSEVAEIWKTKSGKLGSLTLYFDTADFQKSMA